MRRLAKLRAFQRRAETIHRNAEALFSDMWDFYGEDGRIGGGDATDHAAELTESAEATCRMIARAIDTEKTKK